MKRRHVLALAATCALAVPVAAAAPASAAVGAAYSAAAYAQPGSLTTSVGVGGLIGGLLAPVLNPVLSSVSSLTSSLVQVPQSLVNALSTGIVNATGTSASSPASTTDMGTGFPTCGGATWRPASCYAGVNTSVNAFPLVQAGLTGLQGYTEAATDGAKPYQAATQTAVPQLALLGIPIVNAGVVSSRATCPTTSGSASATSGLTSMSLLGGAVALQAVSGTGVLSATLGGAPLTGIGTVTISGGFTAKVSLDNNLLTVRISFSVGQLIAGLGLTGLDGLLNSAVSSTIALTVTIGPGTSVTGSGAATAWGLDVAADLSGALNIDVAGLASVSVTIPTAVGSALGGNLLDLKLAYSSCNSGAPPSTAVPIVPNSLI